MINRYCLLKWLLAKLRHEHAANAFQALSTLTQSTEPVTAHSLERLSVALQEPRRPSPQRVLVAR